MAVYLLREVGRTTNAAQADHATAPAPAKTETQPAIAKTEAPSRAVIPKEQVKITPSVQPADTETPKPDLPVEEVQPPTVARIGPSGPNPKMEAVMAEANRAYDHGDFDDAKAIAQKVLTKEPTNVRMLRIVVSSECIAGDAAEAQKYFAQLPASDRAQMRTRCDRYGVTLKDP